MKIHRIKLLLVFSPMLHPFLSGEEDAKEYAIPEAHYAEGRFIQISPDEEIVQKVKRIENEVLDKGGGEIPGVYIVELIDIFPYQVVNPLTKRKEGATLEKRTVSELSSEVVKECGGEILQIRGRECSFKVYASEEEIECIKGRKIIQSVGKYVNFRLTPF